MGFLSNINNEIVLDAVLTQHGRQKLANGEKLGITKFALSDDGVDYLLYSSLNPYGTDYYDIAIRRLPTLEPIPNTPTNIRYKLFTSTANETNIYNVLISGEGPIIYSSPNTYQISPYLNPEVDDTSAIWYTFTLSKPAGSNAPSSLVTLINGIDSTKGITNDMSLAMQETPTTSTFAIGHFVKIRVLAQDMYVLPYAYTLTINGYGPNMSSRLLNVIIVIPPYTRGGADTIQPVMEL
jgi:hypothetical protein